MPDLSHVGRRYLAPGQAVSAERVAEYASAVSGADAVYSPGSVPPAFAAVYCLLPSLAKVLADAELGIELAGLIHAEQSFEWPVPVRPGDVVEASAQVASVESKRGMTFVTLDLAATNQSGHTVCRGRSLLLLRGAGR
ncbi:MAG: MaoC family dehydratase N-terminal domain-containing protein [Candidatus Dormibacteria bacterium]